MNRGAVFFWLLVGFLFGSSIFFGIRVVAFGSGEDSVAGTENTSEGSPGSP